MQRVVVNPDQIAGDILRLTAEQQHYLTRVLRLQAGDCFWALDGVGNFWLGTLTACPTEVHLSPSTEIAANPGWQHQPKITLAASLPKQGFDEVVRQVTELGVHQIVPIISDRTLLRPSPNKLLRWRRIAAEAAEQSERLLVPEVREPIAWLDWLTEESQEHRYLCAPRKFAQSLLVICLDNLPEAIEVAVGPEGGWTDDEMQMAVANGYQLVNLGDRILRAVTASVAAVSVLQAGFEFATMYQPRDMQSWTPSKP